MGLENILRNMSKDIEKSENYLLLAEHYIDINPNLSFLSLQNAFFYENDVNKKNQISLMMEELVSSGYVTVKPASFVIVSFHNLQYIKKCLESIRMTCCAGSYEIVVVDNGSEVEVVEYLKKQTDIKLILNSENAGFPAGCNQGMEAAESGNDIFLLNNDTVMMPNALYCMRMALYSDEKTGAVGSMGSSAANFQKADGTDSVDSCINYAIHSNIPDPSKYEKKVWLVGFALLIRHDVYEKVGKIDERFSPGNYEDNDYCYRILEKGYQNVLCHNSLIYHYGGGSFQADEKHQEYVDLCNTNRDKLNNKWGFAIDYYGHQRREIINFIVSDHPDPRDKFTVLECGCGMGSTLLLIQYLYPNAGVYGIELMEKPAKLGKTLCNIVQGNVEHMDLKNIVQDVDYVIFGDVIEHLVDPYGMLCKCHDILKKDGQILASIPNIMHHSVIVPLLKGFFDFEKEGIRDYTHLHNFTYDNIICMFQDCGYTVGDDMFYIMREREDWIDGLDEEDKEWVRALVECNRTAPKEQFSIYQYLVRAKNND